MSEQLENNFRFCLFLGYLFLVVLTFGHNYNNTNKTRCCNLVTGQILQRGSMEISVESLFVGGFWPLYWSVDFFSKEGK
jgi:hypothetical protein